MNSQALRNDGMTHFKEMTNTVLDVYQNGCLMLLDVKNFQQINHQYGYEFGGYVLSEINSRLQTVISTHGNTIHYSADQFFLFIHHFCDKEFAAQLYRNIDDTFDAPFTTENIQCNLSFRLASINYDGDGDYDDMFHTLEYSMKHLRMSDESFSFSESVPPFKFRSYTAFRDAFFSAKRKEELCFYLQPKRRLDDGTLVGAEALVRWIDNDCHYPTSLVLRCFERYNMMDELAIYSVDYVINCLQLGIDCPLSLNLSLVQLDSKRVFKYFFEIAQRYPELIHKIEIEVTEDSLLLNHSNSLRHLIKLRQLGFDMAIDDFGKAFSNLQRIIEINPKTVKIDKIFTDTVIDCKVTQNVIKALVMMSDSQKSSIVAEGIESQEQVDCLLNMGVTIGQGYHLGHPVHKNTFITLFERRV
jgi:EAL domain-containing protein (putative c-di-GMP-specific phosphodiesterase class I)/GGDEF domain-containing protein